jgi:hypothetical protein
MKCLWVMNNSYLLVDEVLIIVLDVEFPLHLLDLSPLYEEHTLSRQHLLPCQLPLTDKRDQLASILQFFSESPQFIRTLGISAASFADLSDFAPSEADIWVCVVGFLTCLELQV